MMADVGFEISQTSAIRNSPYSWFGLNKEKAPLLWGLFYVGEFLTTEETEYGTEFHGVEYLCVTPCPTP